MDGDEVPQRGVREADQRWVSDAEVAETTITVFTSRRKKDHVTCRLVVRRVKRLNLVVSSTKTSKGSVQEELFAAYRHHRFITNSTLSVVEATSGTVTTPWSNTSSPNSRTARSRTCRPDHMPRTPPGSRTR